MFFSSILLLILCWANVRFLHLSCQISIVGSTQSWQWALFAYHMLCSILMLSLSLSIHCIISISYIKTIRLRDIYTPIYSSLCNTLQAITTFIFLLLRLPTHVGSIISIQTQTINWIQLSVKFNIFTNTYSCAIGSITKIILCKFEWLSIVSIPLNRFYFLFCITSNPKFFIP